MPNNIIKKNQQVDVITWEDFMIGVDMVATAIEEMIGDNVAVYGIPRGGMIPAIAIVHNLEARGLRTRFAPDIHHLIPSELHKLVVIDEICDSGDTFQILKQLFPMAKTMTVYHRKAAMFTPDYSANIIDSDRWLVFPWEIST